MYPLAAYLCLLTCLLASSLPAGVHSEKPQNPPEIDSLIQITESQVQDSVVAKAYLELGSFFLKQNGAQSFYYSQKAFDLAKVSLESGQYIRHEDSLVFQTIMAAALNRMGYASNRRGELPKALSFYLESAQLSKEIGDSTHLSSSLFNAGYIYRSLGELDKTLEYLNRSLEIREGMKDTALISSSLNGIGSIYSKMGEYERAQSYFEKSIEYSQQTGFTRITGLSYHSMGTNWALQGDFNLALEYYEKSIEISKSLTDYSTLKQTLFSKAGVKRDQGHTKDAILICNSALRMVIEHDLYDQMGDLHERLSELHASNGNSDSAFFHLQKYIEVKDSITNVKANRQIARFESQYEFGKKILADSLLTENRIYEEQLRTDKQTSVSFAFGIGTVLLLILVISLIYAYRLKERSNKVIQQSLKEKDMLIKEIHHRVKNNLTMVSNLLELQGDFLEDASAKAAIGEGKSRLNSIALIHQQLYQSNEKTSVEMLNFVEELVAELAFAYGTAERGIQIESTVDPIQMDVEMAISLGLILHELLNNALKYAFPESAKGIIQVHLVQKSKQELELIVTDNGIGMPDEVTEDSLGMRLIHLLSDQLKGKLNFVNQSGTRFELVFPMGTQLIKG